VLDARGVLDVERAEPRLRVVARAPAAELERLEAGCWRHTVPAIVLNDSTRHVRSLTLPGRAGLEAALALPCRRQALRTGMLGALRWGAPTSMLADGLAELIGACDRLAAA